MMAASILAGYLLGSFQTAYFVGRFFRGTDIRQEGSSNAGASNVTQVMGWRFGILTALADMLKAYLAVRISLAFFGGEAEAFTAGAAAIMGHMFPFYLQFKGGKGLACLVGAMLAFEPEIGLAMMLAVLFLTLVTDYIAIGTLAAFTGLPVLLYAYGKGPFIISEAVLLAFVGVWRHRENVAKILQKKEKGLRATLKRKKHE